MDVQQAFGSGEGRRAAAFLGPGGALLPGNVGEIAVVSLELEGEAEGMPSSRVHGTMQILQPMRLLLPPHLGK